LNTTANYDVFLSHRYADRDEVRQLHDQIEDEYGYSVYVDWIEHPEFDRSEVTPETAEHLRGVMRGCSTLIFYAGRHAPDSKWMPWELGFFDGRQGARRIAVYADDLSAYHPAQQEYLRLYQIIDRTSLAEFLDVALNDTAAMTSATYDQWRRHADKFARDPVDYGLSVVQWYFGVTANALLDPDRLQAKTDQQPEGPLREPAHMFAPWYGALRQQQTAYAQFRREWRRMRRSLPKSQPAWQLPQVLGSVPFPPAANYQATDARPATHLAPPFNELTLAMNKTMIDSWKRLWFSGNETSFDNFCT
jgi:hypothetical protein